MPEVLIDTSGMESSLVIPLVDDDALVDFTDAPAVSESVNVGRIGTYSFFVDAVPEAGQEIHLQVQASPLNDQSVWFNQSNNKETDVDAGTWVFKATTNPGPVEIGPFYGAARYLRLAYGYNGGDGTDATLKVYFTGRS